MASMAEDQKDAFQMRLDRIKAAAESTGAVEPMPQPTPARRRRGGAMPPLRLSRGVLIGLALGLGTMLAGRVVTFRCQGETSFYLDLLAKTGPWSVVLGLLFVAMVGLGLRDKPHVIGVALGLPLMYFGEPYVAHFALDLWMQMYSPEHVDIMLIQAGLRAPPIL